MAEKIIAQTIAGASEHFLELINEDHEVTETHLKLKSPILVPWENTNITRCLFGVSGNKRILLLLCYYGYNMVLTKRPILYSAG